MKLHISLLFTALLSNQILANYAIDQNQNDAQKLYENLQSARKAYFQHKNKDKINQRKQIRQEAQQCLIDDCLSILGTSAGSCGECKKKCFQAQNVNVNDSEMIRMKDNVVNFKEKAGQNDGQNKKWRKNRRKNWQNRRRNGQKKAGGPKNWKKNNKNNNKKLQNKKNKRDCFQNCSTTCNSVTLGAFKNFNKCKNGCKKNLKNFKKANKNRQ